MSERELSQCCVCGQDIDGQSWVLLNRYGVGTGKARGLSQSASPHGEYLWELNDSGELQECEEYASGVVTCWPACTAMFIEAKMLEVDVEVHGVGE